MKFVELEQVCVIKNGYAFKSEEYKSEGVPLLRISNFNDGDVYVDEDSIFVDPQYLKNKSDFIVEKGDILIALSGATTGKYGFYNYDFPSLLNQRIGLLKSGASQKLYDRYFYFYLTILKSEILRNAGGAAQPNISTKAIGKFQIPLPPLDAQKKIAAILDAADAYRQKTKTLIEKYDQLAQSLFLDMFGDPGVNPKGWEKTNISESCYFVKDGPHVSPKYVQNGVPFISVNNIIKGYWDLDNVRNISEEDHQIYKKRCNPEKGDILYTKGGTTGFAKYIDIDLEFSNWVHLAVLKFDKSKMNGKFFEAMLNSRYCYDQSQIATRGIANRDLVLGQMKKISHLLPPIAIQNQFAERIQLIEAQKQQAQASLQKAEDLFNSLLQRAFKGELVV